MTASKTHGDCQQYLPKLHTQRPARRTNGKLGIHAVPATGRRENHHFPNTEVDQLR